MRILVADDSAAVRARVAEILGGAGHAVVEAGDGVEAITALYRRRPDLVVLDLNMPRLNGWVVCRVIKEDPAVGRTPVIVLTGMEGVEDRYWAGQAGADAVVLKADLERDLLARVESMLTSRAFADLSGRPSPQADLEQVDVLAKVCEMLDRKLFEATVANEISGVGVRALDLEGSLRELLRSLGRLLGFEAAGIALLSERFLGVSLPKPTGAVPAADFIDLAVRRLGEIAHVDLAPSDVRVAFLDGAEQIGTVDDRPWAVSESIPIQARGRLLGVLVLASARPDCLDDRSLRVLRTVEPSLASAVELAVRYHRSLAEEAGSALSSL